MSIPEKKAVLLTKQVASIAGATLRQLQWWDERNYVVPDRKGHNRIYTAQQAVEVQIIAELRRKGLSLQSIRRAVRSLGKRLSEVPRPSHSYLLTDGYLVFVESDVEMILRLMVNHKKAMVVVSIGDCMQRVREYLGRAA